MTNEQLAIIEMLDAFFRPHNDGIEPSVDERIRAVGFQLRACVEAEVPLAFDSTHLGTVHDESGGDPKEVIGGVAHAHQLVEILSAFVRPRWLPDDYTQRTFQLLVVDFLVDLMVNSGLIDVEQLANPLIRIRIAVDNGKANWERQRKSGRGAPRRKLHTGEFFGGVLPGSA